MHGASDQDDVKQEIIDNKEQVESQVKALYAAVLAETSNSEPKKSFEECYDLHIVPASDKEQVRLFVWESSGVCSAVVGAFVFFVSCANDSACVPMFF